MREIMTMRHRLIIDVFIDYHTESGQPVKNTKLFQEIYKQKAILFA